MFQDLERSSGADVGKSRKSEPENVGASEVWVSFPTQAMRGRWDRHVFRSKRPLHFHMQTCLSCGDQSELGCT